MFQNNPLHPPQINQNGFFVPFSGNNPNYPKEQSLYNHNPFIPIKRKKQFEHPISKKRKTNNYESIETTTSSSFIPNNENYETSAKNKKKSLLDELLTLKKHFSHVLRDLESSLNPFAQPLSQNTIISQTSMSVQVVCKNTGFELFFFASLSDVSANNI